MCVCVRLCVCVHDGAHAMQREGPEKWGSTERVYVFLTTAALIRYVQLCGIC